MVEYEQEYAGRGLICGVDEAGAGPLAGPVVAAAVIMPAGLIIDGVNDSKKLTERKRESLYEKITEKAVAWNIALIENDVIDEINILQARLEVMRLAVAGLEPAADFALVDGNINPLALVMPSIAIKGGDGLSHSIACASILAKVVRDRIMVKHHETYPQYGFDKHKGYGTKVHFEAIREHGMCLIHRRSFLTKKRAV